MTRRQVLLALFPALLRGQPDTPRNRTAIAGNRFEEQFARWAARFNAMPSGSLDAGEVAAFEPLPALWRRFEHRRKEWIRQL